MISLSVIIPVYNEEKRLALAFEAVKKFKMPKGLVVDKFIFVNDGSKDNTLSLLKQFKKTTRPVSLAEVEIVNYSENYGRGYAVMQGVKRSKSDYTLFLDSDMSIPLSNLKSIVGDMNLGFDLLVGSKKMKETTTLVKRSLVREVIGSVHSSLLTLVLGIKLADFTGGFKVFSRAVVDEVFPRLTQERWGLDPELIYVTHCLGLSIKEFPIVWRHISTSSKVHLVRDILRAFKEMGTIRFNDWKNIYEINSQPALLNKAFSFLAKFSLLLTIWPKKSS